MSSRNIRILSLSFFFVACVVLLSNQLVSAATAGDAVCEGAGAVVGGSGCSIGADGTSVQTILKLAINILSWIAGVIAVIMVIISGMKYTTSGGDSGKVAGAKRTLIYALIGAGVATVAQTIVRYVISTL